jgi:hypothetical protein
VRSSLFNLCNAPEKRHAVSKKGDIAFGHTMEPSSVSIVCNWPILSKNSFTSPFPWQSFSVSERGDEQHDIDQCSDLNDLCTHLKVVADQHLMANVHPCLREKGTDLFSEK